ncbi:MAG: AAA family ATPase [Gemmatimonadetes bacterium]|nr:AAA family ATPase [Gemmatimonadota bacterium]
MIVVVTGVAGAGKSTIGSRLAKRLGWTYLEADDFHPPANRRKMERGIPLTDDDRGPWLDALERAIRTARNEAIVSCSCLRRRYRDRLRVPGLEVRFVHLRVDRETAKRRTRERTGHFFEPALVDSQFETLEEPTRAVTLDATRPVQEVVREVIERLGLEDPPHPAL